MKYDAGARAQADGTDLLAIFAGISPTALAQIRALQARLQRTTTRERLLLGGLVLAALIYAPIAVFDWRTVQEDRYIDAMTERSAARLARAAAQRITTNAPDQTAIEDMRTWGFEAANVAVAQVRVEQQLVEAATAAGLTNIKITTEPKIEVIGPTQWLGAQIQADLRWTPTFAFLDALTGWVEGFRITQFEYQATTMPAFALANPGLGPTGRVTIGLAVPVSVRDQEPKT